MTRSNLVLGGLLIGLTLLAIFGCGRGSEPPPPPSPPPVAAPPPPPPQPQPQPKEEKKEELPEDLSTWTKDHFILARKKQDKKIFDALEQLIADATAGQRGEEAVSILRALLERPASPQPAGGPGGPYGSPMYGPGMASGMPEEGYSPEYGSPGPSPMPQPQAAQAKDPNFEPDLLKAVASGIVKIATEASLAVIDDLLEGKIEVVNDRLAVETTLRGVVEHIQQPMYEDLVIKVLCKPPRMAKTPGAAGPGGYPDMSPPASEYGSPYPSPDASMYESSTTGEYGSGYPGMAGGPQAKMRGDEIQRLLFDLAKDVLTQKIRMALAAHVMDPQTRQADRQLMMPILTQPVPENLPVLLVFLQKGDSKQPLVMWIMDTLTDVMAAAFAAILGAEDPNGLNDLLALAQQRQIPGLQRGMPGQGGYPSPEGEYGSVPPGYAPGSPTTVATLPEMGAYPGASPPGPEYSSETSVGPYPGQPGMRPGLSGGVMTTPQGLPKLVAAERRLAVRGLPRDVALKVAPILWGPDLINFVDSRLMQARSLKDNPREILMAATLPRDATRARLASLFRANLENGPEPLAALGFGNNLFVDPGLVVVVKSLPREDLPKPSTSPTTPRTLGRRPPMGRPGQYGQPGARPYPGGETDQYSPADSPYGGGPGGAQSQLTLTPKMRWMLMSESLSRSICKKLKEAGDRLATIDPASLDTTSQKRPPEFQALHPNASVISEYHLDWPNSQLKQELPNVQFDPMRVHYIRLESHSNPNVVAGFYRRKLSTINQRTIADGIWLDGLQTLTDGKPRRQSIDIFITHDAGEIGPQDQVDVVVELLSVEILSREAAAARIGGDTALR
ncbi:MAG TPA: hypothetical protein PLO20_13920 [Thermogutta sp.]|nr:hypothetical protein [Thermogutta sp.]